METFEFYLKCGHIREAKGYIASEFKKHKKAYCISCRKYQKVVMVK